MKLISSDLWDDIVLGAFTFKDVVSNICFNTHKINKIISYNISYHIEEETYKRDKNNKGVK